VRIKAEIVSKDPYEKSLRKILNFGHTAGHAIEALSHLNQDPEQVLLHGEAIAFGMLMESRISYLRGILTATELEQIENTLQYCGYRTTLGFNIETEEFNQFLKKDKKNSAGITNWTLLAKIGQAIFDQQLDQKLVEEALASINKQ
jgi:3-dehydroquinate synthase